MDPFRYAGRPMISPADRPITYFLGLVTRIFSTFLISSFIEIALLPYLETVRASLIAL
jgi:hypothetical protein